MIELVLKATLGPMLIAFSAMSIVERMCVVNTTFRDSSYKGWLLLFGLFGGILTGYYLVHGYPEIPPRSSLQWFFYLISGGFLWALIEYKYFSENSHLVQGILRFFLSSLAFLVLLKSRWNYEWTLMEAIVWIAGLSLVVVVIWFGQQHIVSLRNNKKIFDKIPVSWFLLINMGLSAALLAGSGSLLQGLLGGSICCAFLPFLYLEWKTGSFDKGLAIGLSAVVSFILFPLLVCGYFYSEVSLISSLLMIISWGLFSVSRAQDKVIFTSVLFSLGALGYSIFESLSSVPSGY